MLSSSNWHCRSLESRAPDQHRTRLRGAAPSVAGEEMGARRAELAGLKIGELRKQARTADVAMDMVEAAVDEEDKPLIIDLILAAEAAREAVAVRAELTQLKTAALRKRAKAEGADILRVEEAIDDEDKVAIMATGGGLPEGVPSRREETGPEPEPEPEPELELAPALEPEPEPQPKSAPELEPELPPGWEKQYNATQQPYYIDHNTKTTHWTPPELAGPNPGG